MTVSLTRLPLSSWQSRMRCFCTIEERFAFGEVERDIYERVSNKLKEELTKLDTSLASMQKELSNPVKFIDKSLEICSNLAELWDSSECSHRKQMQELFFPEGILYDKKISGYRTQNVNVVLEVITSISNKIKEIGNTASQKTFDLPALVVPTGIVRYFYSLQNQYLNQSQAFSIHRIIHH